MASTVRDRKAPSAGMKVDPGSGAPVRREGAGPVASESLAAQSFREGGGFSENREAQPQDFSAEELQSASGSRQSGQPGAAPGYVADQYLKDTSGRPHGKNLKEGGGGLSGGSAKGEGEREGEDGMKKAFEAEVGSVNDPGRVAEQQFALGRGVKGSEARQDELTGETRYDVLDPDVSA
ncbi:hypothetical protein PT974_04394 [Cladobotryum mycophilum]|uniref:Uncharacterized protein n=1 Tax=Cladobotryum mycophilum TaxID=491253 RepID=A0ABR0SVE4_9HYPO